MFTQLRTQRDRCTRSLVGVVFLAALTACGSKSVETTQGSAPPLEPTVSFGVSPETIASGDATTLRWSATNATSCVASGAWSGPRAVSGTESTGALSENSAFLLKCSGPGGSASATTQVAVTARARPPSPPTVTFAATPGSVPRGSASVLAWSSTNAGSCTASGDWSGARGTSGTRSTGALTASKTYSLTCTGLGGSASASVAVTVLPVPTVSLTAAPASISSGSASTLSWGSTDAASCTASGDWSGNRAVSGTESTGVLTGSKSYSLTCTGPGGSASASAQVTVTALPPPPPAPTVSLLGDPLSVAGGGASTLSWTSTNATSCTASGGWSGDLGTSGSQPTGTLDASTAFSLTCTGAGGSASASVTVTVLPPPTVSFTASPGFVPSGTASILSWSSTGATSCSASGDWSGLKGAAGSESTGPLTASRNYTLKCTGPGGSASVAVAVTVLPVPTVSLTATPASITSGSTSTLSWTAT